FYVGTASLAAGTPIRPIGLTAALGLTSIASLVFGDVCALVAAIIAVAQKRRRLVGLAVLAAVSAWVPAFVSGRGFNYIIELHKLFLSK
ncbi:MAG: hypothetical protein PHN75_18115, partial [Syntrophales bacterium]|nr:hypothetical protein [Syntrophales bacterium]